MAKKKIYDIKPPKTTKKVEKDIKEFLGNENKKRTRARRSKNEVRSIRWLPISVGAGLIVILFVWYFAILEMPKAIISIWPKVDILTLKQEMTADKSAIAIDLEKSVIPAMSLKVSKTLSENFIATGNASNDGKASGTITIYNKYSPPKSLTLKTGTHFLSDSGKLFKANKRIVVPSGKKSGSKVIPGTVTVNIQAVEGGESYNIPPSNFSVPGLKGTAYYYTIYASSDESIEGGYAGEVKKVIADDISQARSTLTDKARAEAIFELKNQISSDYVLIEDAVFSRTIEAFSDVEAGKVVDNFNYEVTVEVETIVFKKSDIEKFVTDTILSQVENGYVLLEDGFEINYSNSAVDISEGKITLDLEVSSGIYERIDANSISLLLQGKNVNQIEETIDNSIGEKIFKKEIKLWPFWVKLSPKKQKAINIELKFD